jgi:hypothetical protein
MPLISFPLPFLQVACKRYDAKALFLKWDSGFITMCFGQFAHGSKRDKTISRAIGENLTYDDLAKSFKIEACRPRAVDDFEGRRNVMTVSFPVASLIPECIFAFETAKMRDLFMQKLQARATGSDS